VNLPGIVEQRGGQLGFWVGRESWKASVAFVFGKDSSGELEGWFFNKHSGKSYGQKRIPSPRVAEDFAELPWPAAVDRDVLYVALVVMAGVRDRAVLEACDGRTGRVVDATTGALLATCPGSDPESGCLQHTPG